MTQTAQKQSPLVKYRKANYLTQEKFADLIGINQGAYCKIETGKKVPSFNLAKKISQTTGIPIGELFERYKI